MEFHVRLYRPISDLGTIERTIQAVDPAALLDVDPAGETLRIATGLDASELACLIGRTGYGIDPAQVTQLPSVCCGGCGG
jgi:hypothetical protein